MIGYIFILINKVEEVIDVRVFKFFLNLDDLKLFLDLRYFNGRVKDLKYNFFWEEM